VYKKIIFACFIGATLSGCGNVPEKLDYPIIPRSILLAKPDRFCVSINHSGDKIAYLARNNQEMELRVEDLLGKVVVKFPVKSSRNLCHFTWAYTDNHILILQDNNGDENDHVFCLDIRTGESKDLTPFEGAKSFIEKTSKKYPSEIIVASNKDDPQWFDAYRINIITGEQSKVFENKDEYLNFGFDHDFNLRIVSKTLSNGDCDVYLMKDSKPVFFKKIPFEDSKNSTFTHFSADGKVVYALESMNRDKSALVAYDLEKATSRLIFENDQADVDAFHCDPNSFIPQYVTVNYLKPEIYVLDPAILEDMKYLKTKSGSKEINVVGRNEKDDTWLVSFSGSDSPTKYYLYKRDPEKKASISLTLLFSTQPELEQYNLQEKTPVIIKSRDGLDLVCYLTKSVDYQEGVPSKLVVYVHGGPWWRDTVGFHKDVQLLANRGYSVLQINYRGSTGFGKRFINAANGNLDKIRNDIIDGVNWAIEHKIADKKKIAIMGGSFGGYSTLAGLAFTPDVFCCGVDCVGPSNWLTTVETVPAYWIPHMVGWYKLIGDPKTPEGRALALRNSPITYVNNIKKPLVIFQGEHDPRVNKRESDQMVEALKNRGLQVAYVLYPDEGHGFNREPNNQSYLALTEIFLSKMLGGRFEPIKEGELADSSHKILEGKEIIEPKQ